MMGLRKASLAKLGRGLDYGADLLMKSQMAKPANSSARLPTRSSRPHTRSGDGRSLEAGIFHPAFDPRLANVAVAGADLFGFQIDFRPLGKHGHTSN